jgi:hypothetical protein
LSERGKERQMGRGGERERGRKYLILKKVYVKS